MITHLEPDILEGKVKWALGSITVNKASGGDGIPAELFQVLKGDAVTAPANLENSAVATGWKSSVFTHSNHKERQRLRMLKGPLSCTHLILNLSNAQHSQSRLQQYMSHELPDVQVGFRKGRGTRDQIGDIHLIYQKSKRVPGKHLLLLF